MTKLLLILGLLVGIFLPGESLAQENKSNFVHVSLVDRMQQDSKRNVYRTVCCLLVVEISFREKTDVIICLSAAG